VLQIGLKADLGYLRASLYRKHSQYPERRRTGRQPYERTESEAEHDPTDDDSPTPKNMQARPQVAAQFSRTKRKGKSKVGHLAPRIFVCWGHLLRGEIRLRKMSRRRTRKFDVENLNYQGSARGAKCRRPCLVPTFARLP
jgi:hypothetical protein